MEEQYVVVVVVVVVVGNARGVVLMHVVQFGNSIDKRVQARWWKLCVRTWRPNRQVQ